MKKYLDNLRQYQFLLSELVKKGIKLKYRRSYLGILWSMLEPLLSMVVLTIVFGTLYGNTDKTFPVYILSGRLLYSFYSSATKAALKSIQIQCSNDQESVCTEISVSTFNCNLYILFF